MRISDWSSDVCSSDLGATFGFSIGSSWTDENGMLLEQVRTGAAVLGDKVVASEMMCEVESYAAARARAGNPCGGAAPAVASSAKPAVVATRTPTEAEKAVRYSGTDPIVRARLGLPPLK